MKRGVDSTSHRKERDIERKTDMVTKQSPTHSIMVYTEKGSTLMAASLWPCLHTPTKGKETACDKVVEEK